jgi:L-iditol 2-dehydrogenase
MKIAMMGGGVPAGVAEVDDPVVADNYVKIKVLSAPLCTEFKHRSRDRRGGFGHEAAGEVVEIGPCVKSVALGDRVVVMPQDSCGVCSLCRSGEYIFCQSQRRPLKICGTKTGRETVGQYMIQQDWMLVKIPAGMSYDHASMACCGFGPAFNAMQSMEVSAGDTVLVSGLGPVGLGAVAVALYRGARVTGLDPSAYRRDLAKQMGAENVFDPTAPDIKEQVLAVTGGIGPEKSVDCTGVQSASQLVLDMARRRGRVAFIQSVDAVSTKAIVWKGLRVYGCWHWNLNDTERMMNTIAGSGEMISKMITHTFPLGRIEEAFELQVSGQCGKVIIHPWED